MRGDYAFGAGVTRLESGKITRLRTIPPADYGKREMTDYSYWVGSLMFYGLYRVVGHDVFCRIIGDYYRRHEAGSGSSSAFVQVANSVSSRDLTAFFDAWLFSTQWGTLVSGAKQPAGLYERYRR